MKRSRDLEGIVKDAHWMVSPGVRYMTRRALDSHRNSPWFGNRPGAVRSNAYLAHMIDSMGYEEVYDDHDDFDYCL